MSQPISHSWALARRWPELDWRWNGVGASRGGLEETRRGHFDSPGALVVRGYWLLAGGLHIKHWQ